MINKLKTFTFCVLVFSLQVHAAGGTYENSWENALSIDDPSFHRNISTRIASAKCHLDSWDKASNIAAFGLRVTATDANTRRSDSVIIDFPNLLYSAYNVSEDKPVSESSGLQIIAVPDLFRGDVISFQSKKHRLWDFCFWLASKDYASGWGLEREISSDAQVICTGNASDMAKITATGQRRDSLQSVLHCEQLFLYKLLTDERLLKDMVDRLFASPHITSILDTNHTDVRFVFEICTYNDMCPKCFSSCFNLHRELSLSLSKEFFKRISVHSVFSKLLGTLQIPIPFEIHISSFRPFLMKSGHLTRIKGRDLPNDYTEFPLFQPKQVFVNNGKIVQFFNPWIAQYIFANEVANFINSMQHLGSANITARWDLLGRFGKLLSTNQIEPSVINEVAGKFVTQKGVFVRPDVCRYVLPFSIELAKYTTQNTGGFQAFVRDVMAVAVTDVNWNIKASELQQLIVDLRTITNQTGAIVSAINDQKMLLNTMLLLESSAKQSGRYDFNNMIRFGNQINLTGVHPAVAGFVKSKITVLGRTLLNEKWSSVPQLYTQLIGILRNI